MEISKLLNLQFNENLVSLVILTVLPCKIIGEKIKISPYLIFKKLNLFLFLDTFLLL